MDAQRFALSFQSSNESIWGCSAPGDLVRVGRAYLPVPLREPCDSHWTKMPGDDRFGPSATCERHHATRRTSWRCQEMPWKKSKRRLILTAQHFQGNVRMTTLPEESWLGFIVARPLGILNHARVWPGSAKWSRAERSFATVEVSNHLSCVTKPSTAQENEYQANTGREI